MLQRHIAEGIDKGKSGDLWLALSSTVMTIVTFVRVERKEEHLDFKKQKEDFNSINSVSA